MSGIATRENEILSKLGFNEYGARGEVSLGNETPPTDVNQQFVDKSIPLSKVDTVVYDAVIDLTGRGDYLSIQEALDDGKRTIFVKKGTYNIKSTIKVPSDTIIVGENSSKTIINGGGTVSKGFNVSGERIDIGTSSVSITNGSATITASGSTFTNASAGDIIVLDFTTKYKIKSIESDTSLTISRDYEGVSRSSVGVVCFTAVDNVRISGVSITDFIDYGIENIYFTNVVLSDINILDFDSSSAPIGIYLGYGFGAVVAAATINNIDGSSGYPTGIQTVYSGGVDIRGCAISGCSYGAYVYTTNGVSVSGCNIFNCSQAGMQVLGSTKISGCSIHDNNYGVVFWIGEGAEISSCSISYNKTDGVISSGGGDRKIINGNYIIGNGGTGINIATGSDKHVVTNNIVYNNSTAQITDNGSGSVVANNIIT